MKRRFRVFRKPSVSEKLPLKTAFSEPYAVANATAGRENARLVRQPTGLSHKSIIFLFYLFFLLLRSYSNDSIMDLSLRFVIPQINDTQASGYLNIGYGKNKTIVPGIFSPGVSFEAGLGLDWIYLMSLFSGENESKKDEEKDFSQFGFNLGSNFGIRLFNLIDIGIADITTFIAYNISILIFRIDKGDYRTVQNPVIGASIVFKIRQLSEQPFGLGLKYAYYVPTIFSSRVALHHIALVFRFREGYWD